MERSHRLDAGPDAVPAARRFVTETLQELSTPPGVVADAQLLVTELVGNALLHAAPPLLVRVLASPSHVRIEVEDGSRAAPLPSRPGPDSMTGRGLSLVTALARRWGVQTIANGKLVWAELAMEDGVLDPLPAPDVAGSWPELPEAETSEPVFTVALGDVPTDLLLAAKAHVDNVVRELTLAGSGASSGRTAALTPDLARLVTTVTTRFSMARQAIKAQALKAAAQGAERTSLVLRLPASAADAGTDYLAAMDEVDTYARAARLLTLESSPEHRAFRRWYVTALVGQLGAQARGEQPEPTPTLERFLLDELASLASAARATDRAARLQSATAALAGADTMAAVAQVVLSEGAAALGASGGGLLVPTEDEQLAVPGTVGYESHVVARLRAEHRDARLPAAEALRTGEPVWLESREARDSRFPELTGLEPNTVSMCAVPLRARNRVLGALRFSFETPRLFDDDERAFVEALAAQTALAIERSVLSDAQQEARAIAETVAGRLQRLHRVTAALAEASTEQDVTDAVVTEAAATLGAVMSALCAREGDLLRIIGLGGARAETRQRWATFPVNSALPASDAVRTQEPIVVADKEQMAARYPLLSGQPLQDGPTVCVPVMASDHVIGALSLTFPPGHEVDAGEVDLLATIGRQCGIALERARLFAAEREARERSAFLADAAAVLGSSLEPAETLSNLTSILVPRLADWAVVYLDEGDGRVELASAAHRDPRLTEIIIEHQRAQPLDGNATNGLVEVLRTGRSLLYDVVPDDLRHRTTEGIEDPQVAAAFTPTSAIGAALKARGRVLGAVALARTGGPPYTEADLSLIEELSGRAAVAVDNAQSYRRERDAALTLQRSLLPQLVPRVAGVSLAWRYLPGAAGTHIGGDWYDVIPLEQGRVGLVIGDVMGRGLRAAALMGQLRATARAHASAEIGPGAVLARLDAALARLEQDQITTVLFAVLDPASRSLTVAAAGHLPPLLRSADGAAYLEVVPGPPLGAGHADYPELRVTVPGGATLLFYTDGLVEDRELSVDIGMEKLRASVEDVASPEELCDRALAALGRDTQHDDDTAMLAVRLDD
jgi:serine phosphatase RsbU (regulator of sigma subunit)